MDQNFNIAFNSIHVQANRLNVKVLKVMLSVLTIRMAEGPKSRHGVLGQVISFSSPVVVGVVHLLLRVKPVVGRHGYTDDDKW
jgi:hypothetical protein